jgi:hypothetical protein
MIVAFHVSKDHGKAMVSIRAKTSTWPRPIVSMPLFLDGPTGVPPVFPRSSDGTEPWSTVVHRVRSMLDGQRIHTSIALRSHLSEFGVVAPIGRNGIERLLVVINVESDARIPADARLCVRMLEAQLKVVVGRGRSHQLGGKSRHCKPGCRKRRHKFVAWCIAETHEWRPYGREVGMAAEPRCRRFQRGDHGSCLEYLPHRVEECAPWGGH